jgi:cell division septation protein DedD
VQAGLFVGPIQSGRLAEGIRGLGFPAYVTQREMGGKSLYQVLAGPFADRESACVALEPMRKKLGVQAYLTDPREPGKRLP